MGQLRLRKRQMLAAELVRNFYESMLMLALGILMQWNQWHVVSLLKVDHLSEGILTPQPLNWASLFFTSGLLLTLLQYRPEWIKRCVPPYRKMFLWVEIFYVLFLVDFALLTIWQPLFTIINQILHTLGHSQRPWANIIFRYCPSLSDWLINDAFYFVRFMTSLTWFLLAIEMSAPKWRQAIDYLVLGQLPEVAQRHRRKRLQYRPQIRGRMRLESHC